MMVEGSAFTRTDVFQMAIRVAFVSAVTYFSIKWLVNQIDPTSKSRKKAEERAREQLRKAGLDGRQSLQLDKLSDHEMIIASQLVVPDEITVSWKDIAGLDHLIQELRETVILPIQKRELFADSKLTQPPKGVLLHGPPGCGKTLIAKATAKEANMSFINLDVSLLTDKWYGETQKLAAAVFSLAVKLQPCIVFIDEIESFLRTRTQHDHEATAMMKTQFMSLWDGLITDNQCTVIIMGATNRPQDLDKAIQRRMPATFHVPMPSDAQREHILKLIMQQEPVATDIDYKRLAIATEGFSGSDLHELCRQAAVYRVRDMAREEIARESNENTAQNKSSGDSEDEFVDAIRPITMDDLRLSLFKLKESKIQCGSLAPSMRTMLNALIWEQYQSSGKSNDCIYRNVLKALANMEGNQPRNVTSEKYTRENNVPQTYYQPSGCKPSDTNAVPFYHSAQSKEPSCHTSEEKVPSCHTSEGKGSTCHTSEDKGPSRHTCEEIGSAYHTLEEKGLAYRTTEEREASSEEKRSSCLTSEEKGPSCRTYEEKGLAYHNLEDKRPTYHTSDGKGSLYHTSEDKGPSYHASEEKRPTYHTSEEKGPSYHTSKEKGPSYHTSEEKGASCHTSEKNGSEKYSESLDNSEGEIDSVSSYHTSDGNPSKENTEEVSFEESNPITKDSPRVRLAKEIFASASTENSKLSHSKIHRTKVKN